MLPVLTRYLSPSEYGLVALVMAFGALAFNISNLGLLDAFARLYFIWRHDLETLRRALSTLIWFLLALSTVTGLLLWPWADRLAELFLSESQFGSFIVVGLVLALCTQAPEILRVLLMNTENPGTNALVRGVVAGCYSTLRLFGVVGLGL